jgi:FkbM family methyltransferase
MKFISYAQNFEDVLLWRALGHVEHGFYIDVGANDPVDHSVTKAFYDAGWSGINIEPLPAFHQAFQQQRPRDINLAIAAGASEGSITLFDVPSVNGWASPERAVADAHRAEGFDVTELTVPVRTLASVCAEHVDGPIHFLKIDVEGFEGEVLRGMDFGKWRPWLLVVEATLPNSRVTNHESWEPMVTGQRYRYAHFDGLNRYYVAEEHAELVEVLSIQPNVFDNFISHHLDSAWRANKAALAANALASERMAEAAKRQWQAELASEKARDQVRSLTEANLATSAELASALEKMYAAQHWGADLEQRLLATLASTSWRVTRPLRSAGTLARRVRAVSPKAIAKRTLRRVVMRVTASERMRRLLIPLLLRLPGQGAKLSQLVSAIKQAPPENAHVADEVPPELRGLPVSARKVLLDLRQARRAAREG